MRVAQAITVSEGDGAHGLKPHRVDTFKVSRDPRFAEKLEDIIGLYVSAPQPLIVFSVDEASQNYAAHRGVFHSVDELTTAIEEYVENHNRQLKPLSGQPRPPTSCKKSPALNRPWISSHLNDSPTRWRSDKVRFRNIVDAGA